MGIRLGKPKDGLIPCLAEKPAKPHKCSPPGKGTHFWFWLFGDPLEENSVWRCDSCGQVWKYRKVKLHTSPYPGGEPYLADHLMWAHADIEDWVTAGGRT